MPLGFPAVTPIRDRSEVALRVEQIRQRLSAIDAEVTRLASVADASSVASQVTALTRAAQQLALRISVLEGALGTTDTLALAAVVRRGAGGRGWQRIDPATRTFQALRIWVNEELEGLDRFIVDAADCLAAAGRLVIIAFHSLEDRVVKHTFRELAARRDDVRVVTRKPVIPGDDECARNPRARSARLRVLERVA